MKYIFLDTEFTDFQNMDLISIGFSMIDGHTFYGENKNFNRSWCSPFVVENILPLLNNDYAYNLETLSKKTYDWLANFNEPITLVGDYIGDIELLNKLLNNDIPSNVKGFKNIFSLLSTETYKHLSKNNLPASYDFSKLNEHYNQSFYNYLNKHNKKAHNALDDAKGNQFAFFSCLDFIKKI